ALVVLRPRPGAQNALVRAIEGDDQVVVGEGGRTELPRPMLRPVVAVTFERLQSAVVRALAEVPVAGSSAARHHARAEAVLLRERTEHDFGHGRAADVARADEDDAEGIRAGHTTIVPV